MTWTECGCASCPGAAACVLPLPEPQPSATRKAEWILVSPEGES